MTAAPPSAASAPSAPAGTAQQAPARSRTSRRAPKPPRLYFSFRSPYSWLAVTRLRQEVPGAFSALEWVPFWDPDERTSAMLAERGAEFHYVQMSRSKHLYLLSDTKRLARELGLPMAWPIDIDPWWELPHLGWLVARRLGWAEEFYDAVTAARWGEGRNVCEPEVMADVCRAAGLDADAVLAAPSDPQVREEAVQCLVNAYHDDIFGIPYLRLGRERYWGFDRVDAFVKHWRSEQPAPAPSDPEPPVAPEAPVALPAGAAGYDTDTAGGCG